MKIIILSFLTYSLLFGENNVTKRYYDDEHIMSIKIRKDNNITKHKRYYYSGALKIISYNQGYNHIGIRTSYYPNGQISGKVYYGKNVRKIVGYPHDVRKMVIYPSNETEYFKVALEGGARGYAMREDLNATKESLFNIPYKKIEDNYYLRIYDHLGYMVKETLYKNGKVFGEVKVFEHNESLPARFYQCGGSK